MLIAVDTNVVVRLVVGDHPVQFAAASALLKEHQLLIPMTVLLETEWVLRSRYRYSKNQVAEAMKALMVLDHVVLPQPHLIRWAIDRHAEGADFADMIHIAAAGDVDAFASFEKDIPKRAGPDCPLPVITPV